jgi:hypothetical protein
MLQPDNSIVTVCAVASLLHAQTAPSPSGMELTVKPMLGLRLAPRVFENWRIKYMIINHLTEYIEDTKEEIEYFDFEYDDIPEKERSLFFRKLQYRLGVLIVVFNYLERLIEECILDFVNSRGEDTRIWILIKDFNLDKKIKALKELYLEGIRITGKKENKDKVNELFNEIDSIRIKRNTFIHSNWLNTINLKYFEVKIKKVDEIKGYMRTRKHLKIEDIESLISNIEGVIDKLEQMNSDMDLE